MAHNISAYGIYPSQTAVSEAVDAIRASGFRSTDISVLFPENAGSKDFGHEKHSKAPEGAAAGGGLGAIAGGAFGWFAGAGALAVPGLEPFAAAGPILGMFSGAGVLGVAGSLFGGLMGAGIPEYEAKRYVGRIRRGGILLSVHCDTSEWARTAVKVLKQTGAVNVGMAREGRSDFKTLQNSTPTTHVPSR